MRHGRHGEGNQGEGQQTLVEVLNDIPGIVVNQ
jgi:hypothetical protein